MFLRFFLYFVLFVVAVRMIGRFFGGLIDGLTPNSGGGGPARGRGSAAPKGELMVRDPVCGTFIVPTRAITIGRGGQERFFCSEKCRNEYLARQKH
jgi:YHS domain-containing protein